MAQPDNYSSPLVQALQSQQPDLGGALLGGFQQGLMRPLQQAQMQAQISQQQQLLQARQDFISNPTPQSVRALAALDPQNFSAINTAHSLQTQDAQNQNVRDLSSFAALAQAGRYDDAKALAQQRVDADNAAGQDSSAAQALLNTLNADPTKAAGVAHYMLAGMVGPDKWAEANKDLADSDRANAKLPGEIALSKAQAAQATAAANKDKYLPVNNEMGGQDVLNISGEGGAPPPAAGGAAASGSPAAFTGPAGQAVAAAADKVGATVQDKDYLARTLTLESHGHPDAQNGSSTGAFQMQPKTFAGVGGSDIGSVEQQTLGTLKLARQNAMQMKGMIGRLPTAAELYLAHQQGATGASGLIGADPNTNAIQALIGVGVSPAKAKASILGNGGTADMTAGQFVQKWQQAYAGVGAAPAGGEGADDQPQLGPGVSVAYKGGGGGANKLTPEAIDYIAQQYVATGQLPPLGMGKAATINRDAVLNRAQQIEAETGSTGADAVARHATMKAAQSTLTQVTKTAAMVTAAENTVSANMNIVSGLAPKGGGPTGSPMLNAPIQALRKNVWGSDKVAQFDAAIGTVADEYAKVMTSATGTGGQGSSDSARAEAYSRLSKASTIGQLQGVMTTMRQEMANRTSSLAQQRAEQLAILSNRGAGATAAQAPSATPSGPRLSPAQAQALKPGTPVIGLDGVARVRH